MAYATIVKYTFFYTNWSTCCVLCSEARFSHALDLAALQCPCILIYLMFLMSIHYSMEWFLYVYLTVATLITM